MIVTPPTLKFNGTRMQPILNKKVHSTSRVAEHKSHIASTEQQNHGA
jgi:hypothetical protein